MSPASSTTSLPVSPLTEEPLPFKVKINFKMFLKLFLKFLGSSKCIYFAM